jgi:hypothetical protein
MFTVVELGLFILAVALLFGPAIYRAKMHERYLDNDDEWY